MTFCPEWGGREHALVVYGARSIADGDMINVKTPDGFSTTIRVYIPCKIPYNNADDIVY
jgi:hypothetical protein